MLLALSQRGSEPLWGFLGLRGGLGYGSGAHAVPAELPSLVLSQGQQRLPAGTQRGSEGDRSDWQLGSLNSNTFTNETR